MEYYLFKRFPGRGYKETYNQVVNNDIIGSLRHNAWRWQRHEIIEQIYWGRHGFIVHDMIDQIDIESVEHKMNIHVWHNRVKVVVNGEQELLGTDPYNSPVFFLYALHKATGYEVYDPKNDRVLDMDEYDGMRRLIVAESMSILWSKTPMKVWTLGFILLIMGGLMGKGYIGFIGFLLCVLTNLFIGKISREVKIPETIATSQA